MKLHYISGSLLPSKMANSVHVMKMCQAFSKKGAKVTLFGKTTQHDQDQIYSHYSVEKIFNLSLAQTNSGGKRLLYILQNAGKPDIFYGRDSIALWLLSWWSKTPCIFEAHEVYAAPLRRFLTGCLLKKQNYLVVISQGLKASMLQSYPFLKADNILVAHDGADLWTEKKHYEKPESWQGQEGRFQVGYTGSLHQGKGGKQIIQIAKLCPDMDFHIVGGQSDQIETLRLQAPLNVYFYGYQPQIMLKKFLNHFDCVLAPYQKTIHIAGSSNTIENWMSPLKIFEYMAAQKPIICSDIPVITEILDDQKTALLIDPEQPKLWADALYLLQKDSNLSKKLTKNAYQNLVDQYSWDKRAQTILHFITKTIAS